MKFIPPFRPANLRSFTPPSQRFNRRPPPYLTFANQIPEAAPDETSRFFIPDTERFRHVYIAGASQHGKSTLMERMIAQDMENGRGLTVLDPKGDLAEAVLCRVPPKREADCIYIDVKNPIPINFMSWETEQERQTLLADVYQTFMRFSTMTSGDQWLSILRWTIYTLLASKHASFLDIYYFLARRDTQTKILKFVEQENADGRYEDIFHYWEQEYPHLKSPREQPIITRMSLFTTTPPLKRMLGTATAGFDIFEAMETGKIVIVNLMGVGRENGNLVGALFTSRIQQAAFRRQSQRKHLRVPHFFYADEFQNFQTSGFDVILQEAGGFKLGLTLANQGLYQLDNQIRQAMFTNVTAARIAFRLNHDDVSNWKHLLPSNKESIHYIAPDELANLEKYQAFMKLGTRRGFITDTPDPLPPPTREQIYRAQRIRNTTLENYAPAQNATIGTNLSPPCNTAPNPQNKRDASRDEEITPSGVSPISMERKPPKRH